MDLNNLFGDSLDLSRVTYIYRFAESNKKILNFNRHIYKRYGTSVCQLLWTCLFLKLLKT